MGKPLKKHMKHTAVFSAGATERTQPDSRQLSYHRHAKSDKARNNYVNAEGKLLHPFAVQKVAHPGKHILEKQMFQDPCH
jgi:hypothetical protein